MADLPIIFSAPMVLALLAGRKTQTRRLAWKMDCGNRVQWKASPWQKVKAGDRLWVRENWRAISRHDRRKSVDITAANRPGPIWYEAGYWDPALEQTVHFQGADLDAQWVKGKLRPCIHMPRWASRITLIVTATKVEPLQAISGADAEAEGVFRHVAVHSLDHVFRAERGASAIKYFGELWKNLHGPESWEANPEVVALTFRVIKENIDRIKEAA